MRRGPSNTVSMALAAIVTSTVLLCLTACHDDPTSVPVTGHLASFQTTAAFDFATGAFDCSAVAEIPVSECEALVALYNSTGGSEWVDNSGWLATSTPCGWYGVTCNGAAVRHVMSLDLKSNGLTGSIPAEVGDLRILIALYLSDNQLTGSIPAELGGNLGDLRPFRYLDLSYNQLSGEIPRELGFLFDLKAFFLHGNDLTGLVPLEVAQLGSTVENHSGQMCVFTPPGNEGLYCPDTWSYQFADFDGDGFICGVPLIATPEAFLNDLIRVVKTVAVLNDGQANSLVSKLENCLVALDNDRPNTPKMLAAFINEVEGLINGGVLDETSGAPLIDAANEIILLLG